MTLVRLSLRNYMIHRDFTADFNGNLIALTGEMGHGKTTFVGAIQFCLTGEHPPWHREDLLSWGSDSGSACLEFVQDGIPCSIERGLHNSSAVLRIGDETVTGVRNVEKAMTERLGVDKDILKQIGFVQQYEIQSILFDDPGKRERAFQKLLGIGDANKIWTELGPIIQSYSSTENFDASIEALRQSVSHLSADLDGVEERLSAAHAALALIPSRDAQNDELNHLHTIDKTISDLTSVRTSIASAVSEQTELLTRLSADKASLSAIQASCGKSTDDMSAFVNQLRAELASAKAELSSLQRLSGVSDSNGLCPLCGTAVSPGDIERHVSLDLKELAEKASKAEATFVENDRALTLIKTQTQALTTSIDKNTALLVSLDRRLSQDKDRERELVTRLASLVKSDVPSAAEFQQQIQAKLASLRAYASQYDDLIRRISMLEGEKNAKRQQLDQTNAMLDAKVREKERQAPVAGKIDVLTNVRNWFHSSHGPRTMTLSAVKAMTEYVNEYLEALHSEIKVMPDNLGLSFAFEYVDGRPVSDPPPSTAKLSGGQKIELALAFRLAIYRYFGQKMGIMVLDEPTAHLSPAGIEYFGSLLQTVSTLARNMNLQIIMPTHEKEIMPYMDSEIHFS